MSGGAALGSGHAHHSGMAVMGCVLGSGQVQEHDIAGLNTTTGRAPAGGKKVQNCSIQCVDRKYVNQDVSSIRNNHVHTAFQVQGLNPNHHSVPGWGEKYVENNPKVENNAVKCVIATKGDPNMKTVYWGKVEGSITGFNPKPQPKVVSGKKGEESVSSYEPWLTFEKCSEEGSLLYTVRAKDTGSVDVKFKVFKTCTNGTCSCKHTIGGAVAQLLPCRFFTEALLRGDTDPDCDYILRGVIFGFRVIDQDCSATYSGCNYNSSTGPATYDAMSKKLKREIEAGILTIKEGPELCVHPIGAIPKADNTGFRAIIDCSSPAGECVNLSTSQCTTKFAYKSVDNVTEELVQGDHMSVVDVSDAYRAVSIHPDSSKRQGLSWQFGEGSVTFLRDNRLCMGLSSSPFVFSKLSDFIVRCMVRRGHNRVINYLDDFCTITGSYEEGVKAQADLIAVIRNLGFHVSFKKLTTPATTCRFLGISVDAVAMRLYLPQDKLQKLLRCIQGLYTRRRATKLEIQQLGGLVAHCSKVVKGGRTFARRIYNMGGTISRSYHKVRLNQAFKADLRWWLRFAETFNGYANIAPRHTPALCTYSDASTYGFGATHAGDWLAGSWGGGGHQTDNHQLGHHREPSCRECVGVDGELAHINTLEFWPIMCAARRWGHHWSDRNIIMITDNTTVMHAINTGSCRNTQIMSWLYDLFWLAVSFNFDIAAVYIKSGDNTICDSLSRLNEGSAKRRIRTAISQAYMCCHNIFNA